MLEKWVKKCSKKKWINCVKCSQKFNCEQIKIVISYNTSVCCFWYSSYPKLVPSASCLRVCEGRRPLHTRRQEALGTSLFLSLSSSVWLVSNCFWNLTNHVCIKTSAFYSKQPVRVKKYSFKDSTLLFSQYIFGIYSLHQAKMYSLHILFPIYIPKDPLRFSRIQFLQSLKFSPHYLYRRQWREELCGCLLKGGKK